MMARSVFLLVLAVTRAIEPTVLYSFENLTDPTIDSQGLCNLAVPASATASPQTQQQSTSSVGSFLVFNYGAQPVPAPAAGRGLAWQAKTCAPRSGAKGLTIEFLLHPTPQCFLRGGRAGLIGSEGHDISFSLSFDGLTFVAKTTGDQTDDDGILSVDFRGEGVLAADYLWSTTAPQGKWSHMALVRDAATGDMSVWIDGECQPSMRKNGTAAHRARPRTLRASGAGAGGLLIDASNPVALCAGLDELAVYEEALPPSLIYAHYQNAINQSVPYQPADPGGDVPTVVYPDGDNATFYDLDEYPMGTVLPSPGTHAAQPAPGGGGNGTMCAGCMSCADQIRYAPDPRFNASALVKYRTPYHFNWMDPWSYMAGQDVPKPERLNVTLDLMRSLSEKWRYGWMLGGNAVVNASIDEANAHPEWPLHAVIPGERGQLFNGSLPRGCYLQDAKGNFITILGDVIPADQPPTLRPMSAETAAAQGCPDTIFNSDGDAVREKHFQAVADAKRLRRSFDILNSDGEVFIGLMSHKTPSAPAESWDFSKDPVCLADFQASGQPNWESFFSSWRVRLTAGWSDRIMRPLRVAGALFEHTRFSMYQVQGDNPYFGNWSITREIGDPMRNAQSGNSTYFSTADIYLQRPAEWWGGGGPDHGIGWLQNVRRSERAAGDTLFSPFVAAGWNQQVERNVRPAQWLGLMKVLAAWGAEWFYVGFFSLRAPFQDSANWCWQALAPVYAQAVVVTQAADFFYGGELVVNDPNTTFALEDDGTKGSPLLWAGAPNVLAVARKRGDAYLLVLTLQRLSNNARNLASYPPKQASKQGRKCEVRLPGVALPVTVYARPQGSVYIVRNVTSPHPSVVQLDAWHEASHPTRWAAAARGQ